MSDTRRRFLAWVGNVALTGTVSNGFDPPLGASRPLLMLPPVPQLVTEAPPVPADRFPLLAAQGSEMDALLHVKQQVYADAYNDWLEGGLRMARRCRGRNEATIERAIQDGIRKHGCLVEAMLAGDL